MTQKDSFVLYMEFEEQFNRLSMEDSGRLIHAIFQYAKTGTLPEGLPPIVDMAFSCMKGAMDRNQKRYETQCERNSANGRKGGRPRKEPKKDEIKTEKTQSVLEKPTKSLRERDREREPEREPERDPERECEREPESKETRPPTEKKESVLSVGKQDGKEAEELSEIPKEYIELRWERAVLFAKKQQVAPEVLIRLWWQEDGESFLRKTARTPTQTNIQPSGKRGSGHCSPEDHASTQTNIKPSGKRGSGHCLTRGDIGSGHCPLEDHASTQTNIKPSGKRGSGHCLTRGDIGSGHCPPGDHVKSYDLDDFFDAAVQRALDDTPE